MDKEVLLPSGQPLLRTVRSLRGQEVLAELHRPEPRLQGNDKGTKPRLANHGTGNSPKGPPSEMRPQWSPLSASEDRVQKPAEILLRLALMNYS